MRSTLRSETLVALLARLHERAGVEDRQADARVRAREKELGRRLSNPERYELYGNAPLAIEPEVGQLLYVMTVARRPTTLVEFGSSIGISTIYLAAALADSGSGGSLITSELAPEKATSALAHLREAGLERVVEMRLGDALQTLRGIDRPVEMVFLDGRNDLYLRIVQLLEPNLAAHALIVSDLSEDDPSLVDFLTYVRDPRGRYASTTLPLDAGVEVTVWLG
jgi:predicted O-methyltransferase YrrM